jgi:hypothetical protein
MDETAAIVYTAPVDPSEVDDLGSTFEAFVDAETARFHGALRLLTRDRAEAEDLMQDAYLKVWERWQHVRSLEHPDEPRLDGPPRPLVSEDAGCLMGASATTVRVLVSAFLLAYLRRRGFAIFLWYRLAAAVLTFAVMGAGVRPGTA